MEFSLQAALCQYRLKPELRTSPRRRGHGVQPSGCTVSVQAKSLNSEPHRGDAGMEFSLEAKLCQYRLKPELRTSPRRRGHGVQPSGCTVSVQAKSLNSEPHRGDAGMEFSLQAALCQYRLKA